eukprot:COSAG02_NODE_324_length_24643_cov_107.975228_6_plen_2567_part_00
MASDGAEDEGRWARVAPSFTDERLLGWVCYAFGESSVKERLGAIEVLEGAFAEEMCDEEQIEMMNEAIATTVLISLRAAARWRERACIVRLSGFLAKLCETYAQARVGLAKSIVKAAAKKSLDSQAAYTILNWSLAIVPKLEGKAQSNQVLAAAQCLTRIARAAEARPDSKSAERQLHTASKAFLKMLGAVPGAAPAYMASLVADDFAVDGSTAAATGVILKFLAECGVLADYKQQLGELYCKSVLGAKKALAERHFSCFDAFLASLTAAELAEIISPTIPKAIKRGPDIVGLPLARLAAALTCDLGAVARDILMPFVVEHVKDGKADRCEVAFRIVSSLAQSHDAELVLSLMHSLSDALGSASLPEQKLALIKMLDPLASTEADLSAAAPEAVGKLVPLMQAEKTPDLKITFLEAIGSWLVRCPEMPKPFVGSFGKLLKNAKGEAVRRGMLSAALAGIESDELVQQGMELVAPALDILKACAAKQKAEATMRAREGVAAARLLINLATADSAAAEKLEKAGFWKLLLSTEDGAKLGFWNVLSSAGPPAEIVQEVCQLFELLLRDHSHKLDESALNLVYDELVMILTHDSAAARKTAIDSTQRLLNSSPPRSRNYLSAFSKYLNSLGDDYIVKGSSNGYAAFGEGAPGQAEPDDEVHEVRAEVVTGALVLATQHLTVADATAYIMTAHHPLLLGSDYGMVWDRFSRRCLRRMANIPVFRQQLTKITELLLGERGLASPSAIDRKTANYAIQSLARWDFDTFGEVFMPRLKSVLRWEELAALTSMDTEIFLAPDGVIVDPDFKDIMAGVTVASDKKQVKKSATDRGRTALYTAEDAAWEEELRKELEAKQEKKDAGKKGGRGGGKGGRGGGRGGKKEPPKQMSAKEMMEMKAANKLQEETARRAELQELSNAFVENLEALAGMVAADPESAESMMHEHILPLLMPFVGARLPPVSRAAVKTLTDVVAAASAGAGAEPVGRLVPQIVHCIALLQSADDMRKEYEKAGDLASGVTMLVRELSGPDGCQGMPLPPAAFSCVFPAIGAALSGACFEDPNSKEAMALHQPATAILALHTAPDVPYPRIDMLRLLLQSVLVRGAGTLHNLAATLAVKLCLGLTSTDLPAVTESLLSQHSHVRSACLAGLTEAPVLQTHEEMDMNVAAYLYCARSDTDEDNRAEAELAWSTYAYQVDSELCDSLVKLLSVSGVPYVRQSAARAIALAIAEVPESAELILESLRSLYTEYPTVFGSDDPLPETFSLANEESSEGFYSWMVREGVALTLGEAAAMVSADDVEPLFDFLVTRPLGDPVDAVKDAFVDTTLKLMDDLGAEHANIIFPIFEDFLAFPDAQGEEEVYVQDRARQSSVVCLGGLAKHLPAEGGKPQEIMDRLLDALSTPSEPVQQSISKCLPGLMKVQKDRAEELLARVLQVIGEASGHADRRGAAYGLAGLVKGLGLSSLKQHQIIPKLSEMVDPKVNKKNNLSRQGALWAFECLCLTMGRLFEPYVIHILPLLLECFNSGESIREAAFGAADAIMSQLSGQGVKLVLPALLKSIDEADAWRTKQGAIDVLGAMAHCAPRQLSQCLPTVVPRLCQTLQDTHPKVKAASKASLSRIGEVIRNPEIKEISESLLNALSDASYTSKALQRLMDMAFVHAVDAPSLAIIMPILHKSLTDRSTETKKSGCQIVGSMCSLIGDEKDMVPYLPMVLPELQQMLMDHIPEVRAVAAKAIGSLVRGMGETAFPTLVSDLLDRACPPTGELDDYGNEVAVSSTTVERAGAAQGLSEVVAGLGMDRFADMMPDLMERCRDSRPAVREGVLSIFVYMPQACETQDEFEPFIADSLPPVLSGLADEGESVRDIALRAAKVLVEIYGRSALDLLLPALQARLFDEDWRIRLSAVQLLGDLLYKLTGTSGKAVMDEDETGLGTASTQKALIAALGESRRNEVLGALYMLRSDPSHAVGHAANHVWKSVVVNPPKTLKEVMQEMMTMIISSMASDNEDFQTLAGAALGDLVHKMGDSVLPMVLPILMDGIQDEDPVKRQGICLGLGQVIAASTKAMIDQFVEDFIPPVQLALFDEDELVREAAAQTFGAMYRHPEFGRRALDSIVPNLLAEIGDGNEAALDGLRQIVTVRPSLVQTLVPKLVGARAITLPAVKCLATMAGVGDVSLDMYVNSVVPGLFLSFDKVTSTGEGDELMEYAEALVVAIGFESEDIGVMINELHRGLKDTVHSKPSNAVRKASAELLQSLYGEKVPIEQEHHVDSLEILMALLDHEDQEVRLGVWNTISTMIKTVGPKGEDQALMGFIGPARAAFRNLKLKGRREQGPDWNLAGLNVPKGLDPFVDIYQRALLKGNEDNREAGAAGLGELIDVTDRAALQKYIVPITGPLIRVFGDKFSWQVKAAILETFRVLIGKAGIKIKQFVPQLQGIFTKALRNSATQVRSKAVQALEQLLPLFPKNKVDPLVKELNKGLKDGGGDVEDPVGVVEYLLKAVDKVLKLVGENVTSAALADLSPCCVANLFSDSGTPIPLTITAARTEHTRPHSLHGDEDTIFNSNYPETKSFVENSHV